MSNVHDMLPVASAREIASTLWRLTRGRRAWLFGALALFVAEAATALVFPIVVGRLVDDAFEPDGRSVIEIVAPYAIWLVASAAVSGLMAWLAALTMARLAERIVAEMRETFVESALALPRDTVERAGTGDIVTRASNDIAEISNAMPDVLPRVAASVFTLVMVGGGLGAIDLRFLLALIPVAPLWWWTMKFYLRMAPVIYGSMRKTESLRGQQILGTLTNLRAVRAHSLGERQLARTGAASWLVARWAMRTRIVQNQLHGRVVNTELVGLIAVLAIGVWLAAIGDATAGAVTAGALLYLRILGPLGGLLYVMDDLQSALAALGRVLGIPAAEESERKLAAGGDSGASDAVASDPAASDAVAHARGVTFSYREGVPVLHEVDLAVPDGETVAIVGATGSGKSTLASLLAGVYSPDSGSVEHRGDGRVAVVTQETHVFAGTVRENLTLAAPDATDAELWQALDAAAARDVIEQLPDGLDTVVGAGGLELTAATAQHIALARIVLADPALVILDEATADADTADAALLDRAALAIAGGRSAVVIAHRLSQASQADTIVVLDEGRIIEQGTHRELVTASGPYATLWRAWSTDR